MKNIILLFALMFSAQFLSAQDTLSIEYFKGKKYVKVERKEEANFARYKIFNNDKSVSYIVFSLQDNQILTSENYDFGIEYYDLNSAVFDSLKVDSLSQKFFKQAEFVGGEEALRVYLSKIDYPQIAVDNDIEGRIFFQFIVEENGSLSNFVIRRGAHPLLENAVISVAKTFPKMKPATLNGVPIRSVILLSYSFKLG